MSDLLSGLVGVLLATNQPAALSNVVEQATGVRVEIPNLNDPAEREYLQLLAADNAAQAEVARWMEDNDKFTAQGAGLPEGVLTARIKARLDEVRKQYEDFLTRNPKHVEARIAYGSFLNDINDEPAAAAQWERALTLSTNHAAIYNNLANHYGHNGPVEKAFTYYEKAIALDTNEPVYLHNFATTVFLFRKHVREHYGITEQQVFDKAMDLYARALRLDPKNFPLATDVAKCYYGIKPLRIADAKIAWQNALTLAADDVEREGVCLHLARWEIFDQKWDAAHAWLNQVTNAMYQETRTTVLKNLENRRQQAATNAPPVKVTP